MVKTVKKDAKHPISNNRFWIIINNILHIMVAVDTTTTNHHYHIYAFFFIYICTLCILQFNSTELIFVFPSLCVSRYCRWMKCIHIVNYDFELLSKAISGNTKRRMYCVQCTWLEICSRAWQSGQNRGAEPNFTYGIPNDSRITEYSRMPFVVFMLFACVRFERVHNNIFIFFFNYFCEKLH